jgi:hypothetical protein
VAARAARAVDRRAISALAGAVLAAAAPAQAIAGYRAFENKAAPVAFQYPTIYEELPLPPTEQTLVARYVLRDAPAELAHLDEQQFTLGRPRLFVFHFVPSSASAGGAPATLREELERQNRATSWADFVRRLPGIDVVEDPRRPGFYTLRQEGPDGGRLGFLIRRQQGGAEFGVYGFAPADYHRVLQTQLQRVGQSLALTSAVVLDRAVDSIDRVYEHSDLKFIAARKRARADLPRGWQAVDTANYLIVHHGAAAPLLRRLARDIEAMRAVYEARFPTAQPIASLAIVRVCRDKDEYHLYGGPKSSGGFWHPANEELVLFDYSSLAPPADGDAGQRTSPSSQAPGDGDSLLVLYHEAFHQYIHYAVGEFAPHDWFNEGFGDHFSGARVSEATGQVQRIEPSPWRWRTAKDMCATGKDWVPLALLVTAERAQFYNPARARFFYAAAWSFVHFLETSSEARAHRLWSRILPTYFESMKTQYAVVLRRSGARPSLEQRAVAAFEARKLALDAAFVGVDLAELEAAWRRWGATLKEPASVRRARER